MIAADWIKAHPEVTYLHTGICDLNGQWRGKRLPISSLEKVLTDGIRMPMSLVGMDIWGKDVLTSELVFATGDADAKAMATGRGPILTTWTKQPSAFVPLQFFNEDDTIPTCDPRQVLGQVVEAFKAKGLTVVVATELEFYLTTRGSPDTPIQSQISERLSEFDASVGLEEMDHFEDFLNEVYAACEAQDVPADAAISENSQSQFEINLCHVDDPLKAADDAMLFKRIVHGIARKHDLAATFMAKPFGDRAGSGLHVHFSILDKDGNNIFANGTPEGTDTLRHAVGGLIDAMPASMLVFAPHLNSYRRFAPNSHAPRSAAWGYENRTTAIRIPGGPDVARRIEHRVSGADANPYLVLAAILKAALDGMNNKVEPPAPIQGDGYSDDSPALPTEWQAAIDLFAKTDNVFDPQLRRVFVEAKKQELTKFFEVISNFEYRTYLETT